METVIFKIDINDKGAKSQNHECNLNDIFETLEKYNFTGVHELISSKNGCKPYADVDVLCLDKEDYSQRRFQVLLDAQNVLKKLFPKGRVVLFDSSGLSSKGWKISGHFIVNGAGFSTSNIHLQSVMKPYEDLGFDIGVYNKNHTLRMPFCKKPGDDRILKRAFLDEECGEVIVCKAEEIQDYNPDGDEESWKDWLVTIRGNEKLLDLEFFQKDQPALENRDRRQRVRNQDADTEAQKEYQQLPFEKVKTIVMGLNPERAKDYTTWMKTIWAIANYSEKYNMDDDDMFNLAHDFAEQAPNYSEQATTQLYDSKALATKALTIGTLIYWLKEDNPEVYAQLFKPKEVKPKEVTPPANEIDITYYSDVPKLLATNPDEIAVKNWMLRCLKLDQSDNRNQWFGRCRTGWSEINNRQNIPFSDKTSFAEIVVRTETLKNGKIVEIKKSFEDMLIELKNTPAFDNNRINGVRFLPYFTKQDDDPKIINTFEGWMWTFGPQEEDDDIKFINNHIKLIFSDADEYVKKWLARCIQKPTMKAPMIVAYSKKEGVGKDTLAKLIKGVIGSKYTVSLTGTKEILGDFNGTCENTLLTFINEGKQDGQSIYDREAFKSRITETEMFINRKYKEQRKGDNWSKYIGFTNNKNAFPIAANDRRFVVCESSCEMVENREYFKKLAALVESPQMHEKYFRYLSNMNIEDFNVDDIPKTKMRNDLKIRDLPNPLKHIIAICNGERPRLTDLQLADEPLVFNITGLYEDFRVFCNTLGIKDKFISTRANYKDTICLLDHFTNDKQVHRIGHITKRGYNLDSKSIEESLKSYLKEPNFTIEQCRDE